MTPNMMTLIDSPFITDGARYFWCIYYFCGAGEVLYTIPMTQKLCVKYYICMVSLSLSNLAISNNLKKYNLLVFSLNT